MIDFLNILILLGSLQGFIVAGLLFFRRPKKMADRLFAALLSVIALACLNIYLNSQIWYTLDRNWQLFNALMPFILVTAVGPLLYFYVQASVQPGFGLDKRLTKHFYLLAIDILPQLFVALILIGALLKMYNHLPFSPGQLIDTYNIYADIPRWLSLSFYTFKSYRYLQAVGKHENLPWLRQCLTFFAAFQVIWLLFLLPYIVPSLTNRLLNAVEWYPIYIPLAILVYWLGIKGYAIAAQPRKSSNSSLAAFPENVLDNFHKALIRAMEEYHLYLNPDLNLNKLAEHTGIAAKNISLFLNQRLETNFNDFVNAYRIGAVKERILSGNYLHLTIAGIAADCGFNSQATFQRSFKQFTGVSPTQFRKNTAQIGI